MPNLIKYSITNVANSLRKSNVAIGINPINYGPTSTTGFWNGITPPVGGYTIYILPSGSTTPSIVCPPDDSGLIYWVNTLGGSVNNAADAIAYIASANTNVLIANRDYPNIPTSGMVMCFDGGYTGSYSRKTGGVVYDISSNGNNTNLTQASYTGETGGGVLFGQNRFGTQTFSSAPFNGDFTFNIIFKHTNQYPFGDWDFLYTVNAFGVGFTVTTHFDKPRINYGSWFTDVLNTTSSSALTVSQNYMMTVIKSSNVFSCYVNAVSYGTGATTATSITLTDFRIGCGPTANTAVEYWVGNIYIINIYNRVLSLSEITSLYDGYKTIYNI